MSQEEINERRKNQLILAHIHKELKEYVCACGRTGMDYSKLDKQDLSALVDLKCLDKDCDHTRKVEIEYSDDILWY